jgi:SSS family solute:Na+ symporter
MIKPLSDPSYPWIGSTLGVLILGIWYWCTDQSIVQKTLSARGISDARKGTLLCAALKILPLFILVVPGLIAKALYPTIVTGDNAFPTLVLRLMPPGFKGLLIAALMAALMSAMSSVLNSCSTLITIDIYKKTHPTRSERDLVLFGRITTGIIVTLSILWIPVIPYLSSQLYQYLQSVQAYVAAPITAVFLVGVLWRGATAQAAFVTLIVGGLIGAFRFLLDVLRDALHWNLGALEPLARFSFLNFAIVVFTFCVLMIVVLSKTRPVRQPKAIADLTFDWSGGGLASLRGTTSDVVMTLVVAAAILGIWIHFA